MIRTRLLVRSGTPVQLNSGDRSSPSQVYFAGIALFAAKAELVISNAIVLASFSTDSPPSAGSPVEQTAMTTTRRSGTTHDRTRSEDFRIICGAQRILCFE